MRLCIIIDFFRLKYILLLITVGTVVFGQTGARYLMIAPDEFYNTLQPLVEWKYKKGTKPVVYKLSQVGYDSVSIKNFILNCYNTWDITPEYVVLVGYPGYIPMCYYNYSGYYYYTDNYYTNMDSDIYNEILPGRLTAQDTTQLKILINKIFAYERSPLMSDSSWFKKGCAIANCDGTDDSVYLYCMRYAESLAVHNGFTAVDTFCDYYGHNYNNVINAVNDGRMFVLYRGNASIHWYDPFDVNPSSLNNGHKFPVILSTTCRTVSPGTSPILGENFVRLGTPTNLRGAVAFYGGTRNTDGASHLRNAVAIGFLDGLFVDHDITFGQAGEAGRLRVYQQYGDQREYNNFTCLGDPDMNLWTATPCSLDVQHPEFAPFKPYSFDILVKDAASQIPVKNAFVCIAGKADSSVYVLDTTDTNGQAHFSIDPQILNDTLYVTVTGRNLLPYEGAMEVRILDYAYIVYLNSFIDDSVSGNNDGRINPTEEIELPLWIVNISESTGVAIDGKLIANDNYITLIDTMNDFGDVPGNDSAYTGQDGYNFVVSHSCPDGHQIDFELICTDINDSTWSSVFSKTVYAPVFALNSVTLTGGNGNNMIDPGETLSVIITLENNGSTAADSVNAVLNSTGAEVGVVDSTGYFGHIGVDSLKANDSDPYIIVADSGAPVGTIVIFEAFVHSNFLDDTIRFELAIGQKNYYLWNPDPLPLSGENIHAILSSTGYSGDYGTDLPADLSVYNALFVCLGVYSSRYLILQGSTEAMIITDYLNNGGRVYLEGSSAWYVDPYFNNGHDFKPLFGISATTWSYGDMGPIAGQSSTFTNNMYFNYGGENRYMDHIDPSNTGFLIFKDDNNYYNCGVANDPGSYRTVGLSFELGGLVDGTPPSTRAALLDSIMKFFGIMPPGVCEYDDGEYAAVQTMLYAPQPNPCSGRLLISWTVSSLASSEENDGGRIEIFDAAGRLIRRFDNLPNQPVNQMIWSGTDEYGRKVPAGVYFISLKTIDTQDVKKVILLK
jgi:hypothetical protein